MSTARARPELRVVSDVTAAALALFMDLGVRTVVLCGGNTPKHLYESLAATDYQWDEVEFFFGDERCLPQDDPRSDVGMAYRTLVSRVPGRWYPIDGASCDADGYEQTLRNRFGDHPAFDLAFYGLGSDGHTASLFPGKPEVNETVRWVVRVPEAGLEPFVPRVSMTIPLLSAAAVGVFLVAGEEKKWALAALMAGEDIPAARLAPARLIVLADHAAAGDPD